VARRKRRNPVDVTPTPPMDVPMPLRDEVPEWSEETLKTFERLTPLERSWVEHFASGGNASEAYRRATGRKYTDRDTDTSRMNARNIRTRPRVQAAVKAALKDLNFDARMNRSWMLSRLVAALDKVEESSRPRDQGNVVKIIRAIAELKGELVKKVAHSGEVGERSEVRKRMDELIENARRLPLRGTPAGDV
jgi:hypothetical protein